MATETHPGNGTEKILTSDEIVQEDLATFLLERHEIVLVNGDKFVFPRSNWEKEQQIILLLKDIIVPMLKLGLYGNEGMTSEQTSLAIELLLNEGPDKITVAMETLTEKPKEWVVKNLNIETIVGVLIPFFVSKRNLTVAAIGRYLGPLSGLNAPPAQIS